MAKQDIYVDLDLNRNELKNAVFENLAESPETAKSGQLFYNSATSKFQGRIGGEWIDIIDREQLEAAISLLPVPMQFKGTLGTGGTYTAQTLPAASSENQGWTLKVIEDGTYQGVEAEEGDVLISNGEAWVRVPAGDESLDSTYFIDYFYVQTLEDNASITINNSKTVSFTFEYSPNKLEWTGVTIDSGSSYTINDLNTGSYIFMRSDAGTLCGDDNYYGHKVMISSNKNFRVGGKIVTLISSDGIEPNTLPNYCFSGLLMSNKLIDASELILTEKASTWSYYTTFQSSRITKTPILCAEYPESNAYYGMFYGLNTINTIISKAKTWTQQDQFINGTTFSSGDFYNLGRATNIPRNNLGCPVAFTMHTPAEKEDLVQSDWNQSDNTQPDYIKNKPGLPIIHFALTDNGDDTYSVVPSMTAQQLLGELNNNEARVYATASIDGDEALRTDQFLFSDSFIICTVHVLVPAIGGGSTDILIICDDIQNNTWIGEKTLLKTQQTPKQDPVSTGFSGDFIDSITQNENGEITATKKKISLPVSDPIESTFIYRQSGAEELSGDSGTAWINKFYGNTLVWNQLVQNGDFSDGQAPWTVNSSSISISNNIATITSTSDIITARIQQLITAVLGHKYICSFELWGTTTGTALCGVGGSGDGGMATITYTTSRTTYKIISAPSTLNLAGFQIRYNQEEVSGRVIYLSNVNVIDLTQMFGAGNEPTSVSEFEAMYPLSYYSYNAGQLIGNSASGIETVGFNLWDEEWEVGSINSNTGETYSSNNSFRSSNFIEVLPNKNLYLNSNIISTNTGIVIIYYNANQERVGATSESTSAGISFTTPENCRYIKFRGYNGNRNFNNTPLGSTETICINISDPNKNGTYEPYENHTTNFNLSELTGKLGGQGSSVVVFEDSLNKVGQVYDEVEGKRAIKRIGIVDLGSLSWTYSTSYPDTPFFEATEPSIKMVSASELANIISARYETRKASVDFGGGKGISSYGFSGNTPKIRIYDPAYTDVPTFTTAMSGVYAYYELGTYETYILDEEPRNDYPYNRLGTERRLPADTSSSILPPFSALIQYENYCGDAVNGIERRIKQLNLPVPEIADSGKLLGVDENGEFVFLESGYFYTSLPDNTASITFGLEKGYVSVNVTGSTQTFNLAINNTDVNYLFVTNTGLTDCVIALGMQSGGTWTSFVLPHDAILVPSGKSIEMSFISINNHTSLVVTKSEELETTSL